MGRATSSHRTIRPSGEGWMGFRLVIVITILERFSLVKARANQLPAACDPVVSMRSTIVLGRVAGIEIGLNWSWLVVFGLILWSLSAVQFPDALPGRSWQTYAAMGVTATAIFFACLVLHELGHAIQARRDGVTIEGITLWLFGGVAKIAGELPSAGA